MYIFVFKYKIMRKIFLLISIISLLFFNECAQDDPIPYYEVVPVVEVNNAFFDEVYSVRLNITLKVDGVSTTTTWDMPFKGVRYGCNLLKWTGKPVEYQAPTVLEFTVQVLYDVDGNGGFTPIENFTDGYLPKEATWIKVFFEVRDRNNPSDRYVGIKQCSNPTEGEYQAPMVSWNVTSDLNFVPTNEASPDSGARIAAEEICNECVWTKIK